MNRSSSYFHPSKTINRLFDLDNKDKIENNNYEINQDINNNNFENNNQYNNYIEKNRNYNSFIPNTINRATGLKSKFLNNNEYNDYP